MTLDVFMAFRFVLCWTASFAMLSALWRFGMREMAFFRLVREAVGENRCSRWLLGVSASCFTGWMVFNSCYPVCRF